MNNLEKELLDLGKENVEMPKSVKTKVALSYHIIRNSEKKKTHKKWAAAAAILVASLTVATAMTPQAQASIKHIMEDFGISAVNTAADNGYVQKTDISMKHGKDLSMGLNSIIADSRSLTLDFKIQLKDEELAKQYRGLFIDPAFSIRDDQNNLLLSMFDGEKNAGIFDLGGEINLKKQSDGLHYIYTLESSKGLPKLSRINIQLKSVNVKDKDGKLLFSQNNDWNFETTVDKKFNQNTDIVYKLKDSSAPIEVVSAKLTPTGFTISYKDKENTNSNAEDIGSSFITANNKMYPVTTSSDKDGIITADFNNISSFDKCDDITFNLQYFSQDGIKKIVLVK